MSPALSNSRSSSEDLQGVSRRERKKALRRLEIYDTAIKLFVERGYERVTVDDITEAVDIGKGTFFNYYPSKADVLIDYRRQLMDEIHSHGERANGTSARASFKAYFRKFVRCIRRDGTIFDILLREVLARPSEVELIEDWVARRHGIYANFLKLGVECGEITADLDAALVGEMVGDLWTGTLLEWAYRGKRFSLETKMMKKLDLFFDGLKKRGSRGSSGKK